jgi:hypothetical protein
MCSGGRLVADFVAGTKDRPDVPELVDSLTMTADGAWVVRAYKVAREDGDRFVPLTGRGSYPADARAECLAPPRPSRRWLPERPGNGHSAPDPACTCGFHALSGQSWRLPVPALVRLTVVLSGRVLAFETVGGPFAFETAAGDLLFRAARQTVVRVDREPDDFGAQSRWPGFASPPRPFASPPRPFRWPEDPAGRLVRLPTDLPSGAGPERLVLPSECVLVAVRDDAGWCKAKAHAVGTAGARELVGV